MAGEINHGTTCKGCGVPYIEPCHGKDEKCPNKIAADARKKAKVDNADVPNS